MVSRLDRPRLTSRRRLLAGAVSLAAGRMAERATRAATPAVERHQIATIRIERGLEPPVTLGMARVVLRPGAAAWAAIPGGVRIISVESGLLGVAAAPRTKETVSPRDLTVSSEPPQPDEELLLPAGTTMTYGARGVASVRNPGTRAVVLLEAVVIREEPRPLARAFTTTSGVSFQLLASASAASVPAGPLVASLELVRLGQGQALPEDLSRGVVLAYVEAGTLRLSAKEGRVSWARAAASAPYALPGALQTLEAGASRDVTAGGVIFLEQEARLQLVNEGRRVAEILALAVREGPALVP
jgi:hypothetical protein